MIKLTTGKIPIKDIKRVENSRMRSADDVSDLMLDIEQRGLMEPVGIRKEDNALIYGNRRVKAFENLGYTEIDCVFYDNLTNEELILMNLAENMKRRKIGSIEIGRCCKILEEKGMKVTEIAVALGVSKDRVRGCISAYEYTRGTPFEKLIVDGKDMLGQSRKGIADTLVWKIQTSLSRAYKNNKIPKKDWDLLLDSAERGVLNMRSLSILRAIMMGQEENNLIKALDILDKVKVLYPTLAFDDKELIRALRQEKLNTPTELLRQILRNYNKNLLY